MLEKCETIDLHKLEHDYTGPKYSNMVEMYRFKDSSNRWIKCLIQKNYDDKVVRKTRQKEASARYSVDFTPVDYSNFLQNNQL